MSSFIFFILMVVLAYTIGFISGYSTNSQSPKRKTKYSGILDEMYRNRIDTYINNPVVKELQKQEHKY